MLKDEWQMLLPMAMRKVQGGAHDPNLRGKPQRLGEVSLEQWRSWRDWHNVRVLHAVPSMLEDITTIRNADELLHGSRQTKDTIR